jgi:nitroreductase
MADQVRPDGKDWDRAVAFYNAGLASAQIVFEAESMGLKSHYMGGIVHDQIEEVLGLNGVWVVNVITIGKQGDVSAVSEELQLREKSARDRKPLEEIILHGLN